MGKTKKGQPAKPSEKRDTAERLALWYAYGDERRCCGGHLIAARYCCHICGSVDPSNECDKEGVKR